MKLSLDQQDDLDAFLNSDAYKALVVLMEGALKRQQDAVLEYDLSQGPERLVIAKARAEGAASFMRAIMGYRDKRVKGK